MSNAWLSDNSQNTTSVPDTSLKGMEEADESVELIIPSVDTPGEPEDVLDSHRERTGGAGKVPNPLTVARFKEALEKVNKISTATHKPV